MSTAPTDIIALDAVECALLTKLYDVTLPASTVQWKAWHFRILRFFFEASKFVYETQFPFDISIALLDPYTAQCVSGTWIPSLKKCSVILTNSARLPVASYLVSELEGVPDGDSAATIADLDAVLYRWACPCVCGAMLDPYRWAACRCRYGLLAVLRYNAVQTARCPFLGTFLDCKIGVHPKIIYNLWVWYLRQFTKTVGERTDPVAVPSSPKIVFPLSRYESIDALPDTAEVPAPHPCLVMTKGPRFVLQFIPQCSTFKRGAKTLFTELVGCLGALTPPENALVSVQLKNPKWDELVRELGNK